MAEPKKRSGRWSYLNDFQKNDEGSYVYGGIRYTWDEDGGPRRVPHLIKLWVCGLAAMAAIITTGSIPSPYMTILYVVIPYLISFVLGVSVIWGLVRISARGAVIPAYVYEKTVVWLPRRAVACGVFAVLSVICGIIAVFAAETDGPKWQVLSVIIPLAVSLLLLLVFRYLCTKISWKNI